jgi:hypothetical protein
VLQIPTDIIRLLLAAGANPEPGRKIAADYQCKKLLHLFDTEISEP